MAREKRRKAAAEANVSPLFGLPLNDWNPLFGNTDPESLPLQQQEGSNSSSSTDAVPSAGILSGIAPTPTQRQQQRTGGSSEQQQQQQQHPEEEPEPAPNSALPLRQ